MTVAELARYIAALGDVEVAEAYGYTMFFHGTLRMLPFATLLERDTDYDNISQLDVRGVYRLNIGLDKATYGTLELSDDVLAIDQLMPHPHYASQAWVSITAPSSLAVIGPLLAAAYALAKERDQRLA
ncbi:MAG TPA: DUF6194 family protein [Kofleriaceae bacterium]|nr:DUF6194 family protein [Kofleriaceae bacterium]